MGLRLSTTIVKRMANSFPLSPLVNISGIPELLDELSTAVASLHRHPAVLRRGDVIAAESAVRGARSVAEGTQAVSAFSMLAPGTVATTTRTFLRAPLQVVAQAGVRAGGTGSPSPDAASRLQGLARLVTAPGEGAEAWLTVTVLQGEIMGRRLFDDRSAIVAAVIGRAAAISFGADPAGLCVPEVYWRRHRAADVVSGWSASPGDMKNALRFMLRSWIDGAREAQSIVSAA